MSTRRSAGPGVPSAGRPRSLSIEAIDDASGTRTIGALRLDWPPGTQLAATLPLQLRFVRRDIPAASGPSAIEVADLDGDQNPDVILAYRENQLGLFRGTGDGGFEARCRPFVAPGPWTMRAADARAN